MSSSSDYKLSKGLFELRKGNRYHVFVLLCCVALRDQVVMIYARALDEN
jgi:hypothetical protein